VDKVRREQARCRRPIVSEAESERLVAMGAELRRLRQTAGLSLAEVAWAAEVSVQTVWRVETGRRRTRRSTLRRFLDPIVTEAPKLGDLDALLEHLCLVGGDAVAEESIYRDRLERRRKRRSRRREADLARAWERRERQERAAGRPRFRPVDEELPEPSVPWWHPVTEPDPSAAGLSWLDLCGGAGE
jgi:transcriptional regulator with XRE-family HTH domain